MLRGENLYKQQNLRKGHSTSKGCKSWCLRHRLIPLHLRRIGQNDKWQSLRCRGLTQSAASCSYVLPLCTHRDYVNLFYRKRNTHTNQYVFWQQHAGGSAVVRGSSTLVRLTLSQTASEMASCFQGRFKRQSHLTKYLCPNPEKILQNRFSINPMNLSCSNVSWKSRH